MLLSYCRCLVSIHYYKMTCIFPLPMALHHVTFYYYLTTLSQISPELSPFVGAYLSSC